MADTAKPAEAEKETPAEESAPLWTGTGLCCESQADGVPCGGTSGECEACGKAMPVQKAPSKTPRQV